MFSFYIQVSLVILEKRFTINKVQYIYDKMPAPKILGYKRDNLDKPLAPIDNETPPELRGEQLVRDIVDKNNGFPNGISIRDIDEAVVSHIKENYKLKINSKLVPIHSYSRKRYNELLQKWNTSGTGEMELPFISIIRSGVPVQGTNLGEGSYNIPNNETYSLFREKKVINGKAHYFLYKIPQPVQIDLTYTISIYTNNLEDIDLFSEHILFGFSAKQDYAKVKGHNMSLTLENSDDKSETDLEKRRYYSYDYVFLLKGYLLDECKFEKVRTINNINLPIENCNVEKECKVRITTNEDENAQCEKTICFLFERKGDKEIEFQVENDIEILYSNHRAESFDFYVNGLPVTLPIVLNSGDVLKISTNIESRTKLKLYAN